LIDYQEIPMNRIRIGAVVLASLLTPSLLVAQATDSKRVHQAQTHTGVGVVKKIDPTGGTIKLAHEPIKSINWPSMTMDFKVRDKALLDKLAVDSKVEFDFVKEENSYVVYAVRPKD
jgi:Cu/Ag efflux protein CusF